MSDTGTLPGWLKPANRLVKLLHRLGVPLGTIHIITIPGRTTGEPRSTPVSPLTVDGRRYVIAGLADSSWARNARAAGHGRLTRGRAHEDVDLVEVTDPAVRRRVMTAFPTEVPHGVQFFIRLGIVEGAEPAQFAAAADEVAVFETRPAVHRPAAAQP
ncbi:nitroreductase family deazaflavin-dependent oxidoreductase [Cellulomonas sp. zg-ZUI199]|uniref:Nitroreductase family deazaflavin-dependent oxidoreductase n=1 Tax=Cellulomonas wangleii TaxID=2816956 RepID=A0ABX8D8G5_9CELL|nr:MULTISPECIES: nitroreductase/quinone reductase family protein [Cellulomonas]MBO0901780.1 nitroreductase family deazaflavin-dependent oxidoreductase [Cellulomonas sp. zg-ZUI22]MBO0926266.1 nitroreductase family deazaflavin-dependent oxidoreductase [Cellulomonas wangleii]QVI62771.1 nitroreductase family deazaflavin-dependent oxidoreductase [Cellulomonas wangleii]